MKRVRFEVTKDDIRKGVSGSPFLCPVAKAISRQLPNLNFTVGPLSILVRTGDKVRRITLTSLMNELIEDFDAGLGMVPFIFDIMLSDEELT